MRILLLANNVAGLISFRFEVVKAIIEQGHFITISAPFDKRMNELEAIGAKCVTTEIDRRSTNPVKDFMLICHYVNLIRKEKPDVVLSYTIKPNVYGERRFDGGYGKIDAAQMLFHAGRRCVEDQELRRGAEELREVGRVGRALRRHEPDGQVERLGCQDLPDTGRRRFQQ